MFQGASDTEVFGWDVQLPASYFYADGGIIESTRETCLQQAFYTHIDVFDRLVLHNNVAKTVIMVFQTCRALGVDSAEAYRVRMMGEVKSFWGRLCQIF